MPNTNLANRKNIKIPAKLRKPYTSDHRGFDYVFEGYINMYRSKYNLSDGKKIKTKMVEEEGYRLDIQTKAATTFIKKNKQKPFFFCSTCSFSSYSKIFRQIS